MGSNPEGRAQTPAEKAAAREILKTIAEVQENQARSASDPKEKEGHERLAQVARKGLNDLK